MSDRQSTRTFFYQALKRSLQGAGFLGVAAVFHFWLYAHPEYNLHTGGVWYLVVMAVSGILTAVLVPGWLLLNAILGAPRPFVSGALTLNANDSWLAWGVGTWLMSWFLWLVIILIRMRWGGLRGTDIGGRAAGSPGR